MEKILKNKAFIFDIDGVLCSSKRLHELALIKALSDYEIILTEKDHRQKYDGLPTKVKLLKLGVKEELFNQIFDKKQEYTFYLAPDFISYSEEKANLFQELKFRGRKVGVCSNSIRKFSELTLKIMKINKFVDILLSNEDVSKAKPDPEIYNKCISSLQVDKNNCIIYEDSKVGLEAAFKSMANVCYIKNPDYLEEKVKQWLS